MKKSVVTMASALPWCALPLSETETVCPEALPRAIEPLENLVRTLTQTGGREVPRTCFSGYLEQKQPRSTLQGFC